MLRKVASVNLILLLVYTTLSTAIGLYNKQQYSILGAMMVMALAIGLHVTVLLIVSLFHFGRRNQPKGRAYLLSALLVLVIGFSACFGISSFE